MKRLRTENINTPEHFNEVWDHVEEYHYDPTRTNALISTVKDGDIVCDFGAGVFGAVQYIAEKTELKCQLFAIDQSKKAKEIVTERAPAIAFSVQDCTETWFPENIFDVVISGETIEHIEDPAKLVREMVRVCKPGGSIVLSTVNNHCENAKKLEYPEHIWEFTPEDLLGFFEPFGKAEYKVVGDYHFIYFEKCRY
jgi:2-polyprenyl-3-methyl-5-hydroxy-6-metoxy-1,4-benzoquinol methylase